MDKDVTTATHAARNVAENNYLSHEEVNELVDKARACAQGVQTACKRVEELRQQDLQRDQALLVACQSPQSPECLRLRTEAERVQGDLWVGASKYLRPTMYFDKERRDAHALEYAETDIVLLKSRGWTDAEIAGHYASINIVRGILEAVSTAGTIRDFTEAKTPVDILLATLGVVPIGKAANAGDALRAVDKASDAASVAKTVGTNTERAVNPNKLNHIFGDASHKLDDLVKVSGGSQTNAFNAVQDAANTALKEGRLSVGPNGVLPGGQAGAILNVNGVNVQLVGGRIINGEVQIGSFSRRFLNE
jgi:hypothetical protein